MSIKLFFLNIFLSFMILGSSHANASEAILFVSHCKLAIAFDGHREPSPVEAINIGFCFGLMDGVRGANYFLKKANSKYSFCEPSSAKNDDLAKAFVAVMEANSELHNLRGSLAALIALNYSFPCTKN
jgi:hypothetical protein